MKKLSIALLTLLVSLQPVFAEDDFAKEEFKVTALGQSLYMLEGAGGNVTAIIGADGVLLVDDDFAEMAEKLVTKLKSLKGGSPRFIINTHFHYDHTGGNEVFGPTATLIAATSVRERLMSEQILWNKKHPAVPHRALPVLTFDRSVVLHLGDEDVKAIHYPNGHTDGDTVVFFSKANVVSLGDLYFSGMYPIFHPEHGGSLLGLVHNLRKLLKRIPEDAKVVPGHGPLSSKAELVLYNHMILDSIETVQKGINAGRRLDQIQKTGLPGRWDSFSHGYLTTDRWIALLYKSLTRQSLNSSLN
jgi:cyclase